MGKFLVDLNTFKVIKPKDVRKDEPYLWLFGIAISLEAGNSNDPTRFITRRPSAPGNLGGSFKKGESRAIPDGTGKIEKTVTPVFGMLGLGFVVAAWDHDHTPASAVNAAYGDACTVLNDFVQGRVSALDTSDLTEAEIKQLTDDITAHIKNRYGPTMMLRKPSSLNQDDGIGLNYRFFTPDPSSPHNENLDLRFKARGVEYQVTGVVKYTP